VCLGATNARASHLEPAENWIWNTDLSPVGGPEPQGVVHRNQVLAADQVWRERHWLQ
jgi:hypothetical protein